MTRVNLERCETQCQSGWLSQERHGLEVLRLSTSVLMRRPQQTLASKAITYRGDICNQLQPRLGVSRQRFSQKLVNAQTEL